MKKLFFTFIFANAFWYTFASESKSTNMGGQIDIYAEYSSLDNVTLSLGEEISFTNFLSPKDGLFDACNTVFAVSYTPHPNIAIEAGYEFLYSNTEVMEHCAKLSATPQVELGDFALSLQETAQMTYAMADMSYTWQLVSKLELAYNIPVAPLCTYVYVEMTNPLECKATEPSEAQSWYDEFCYRAGLDWSVNEHNTLGIYYEFAHTIDSYSHLIGIGYTVGF